MQTTPRKKVLTVGDGDLTFSLALTRAYGDHVDVTASVLESDRREFLDLFPEAPLEELRQRRVPVLYGIDATQLHARYDYLEHGDKSETSIENETKISKHWDLVSFHHPHLGVSNLRNDTESTRAILHHRLLCHYFYSAKQVSKLVHVCLSGTQPTTWKLMEAAELQNLTLVKNMSDSKPFANVWMNVRNDVCAMKSKSEMETGNNQDTLPETAKIDPKFAAPRRYRNGKLGRHSLARYGYRHRRTEGVLYKGSSKDANVSESMHFVFAEKKSDDRQESGTYGLNDSDAFTYKKCKAYVCAICNESFDTECALKLHLASPVRRQVSPTGSLSRHLDIDLHSRFETPSKEKFNGKCVDPPAPEFPETILLKQRNDDKVGIHLTVSSENQGKRLRWFLHHSKIDSFKFTKRLAESTIKAGQVFVNGQRTLVSSRILHTDDNVTIIKAKQGDIEGHRNANDIFLQKTTIAPKLMFENQPVQIVERSSTSSLKWLVAIKSSGMRTKGNFPGTLESIVSEQEKGTYSCLSSLETSCSGLCILVDTIGNGMDSLSHSHSSRSENKISVMHTLTALVYGILPRDIYSPTRSVSLLLQAKWKQKKRKHVVESLSKPQEEETTPTIFPRTAPADITLKESGIVAERSSTNSSKGLSTLEIVTPEPSSSSICYYFRQQGFPVVGDTFCKEEYLKLKRSIRNRLKKKLCIGCFKVEIKITEARDKKKETTKTHVIEIPSPNKLSANFWEKFSKEETLSNNQVYT